MSLFGYAVWIFIVGLSFFLSIRLKWIYEVKPHHLFWRKPQARHYFLSAILLLLAAGFVLTLRLDPVYVIPLLAGFYVLAASAAVKVSERGIMSNGFLASWPKITHVQRAAEKNQVLVKTSNPWRQLRFEVPPEMEARLRKVLASKRIPWSENAPAFGSEPAIIERPAH